MYNPINSHVQPNDLNMNAQTKALELNAQPNELTCTIQCIHLHNLMSCPAQPNDLNATLTDIVTQLRNYVFVYSGFRFTIRY